MKSINDIVSSRKIPEAIELLPLITSSDGNYLLQEGEHWDFKELWPFSYSDSYFCGLCRLVCAFANTEGGIIIFGVDDKTRLGGHVKTNPNLDKFEQALTQIIGTKIALAHKRIHNPIGGDVDVLLVSRKGPFEPPLCFHIDKPGYKSGVIWVRRGSEVKAAQSSDIPSLYLRSGLDSEAQKSPLGQLPPSPINLREFVGRMQAVDRVFDWIYNGDEPRAFLYGRGGSGKSTIAYEVFRNIRSEGRGMRIAKEDQIDQAIFISAKYKYLNVLDGKADRFVGNDFADEREMYQAILLLGGYEIPEEDYADIRALKTHLQKFFDENSCFLVIDDIDTLTTSGKEAGLDFMHGVLYRAKRRSKLLYTVRNQPSFSLTSSIEVPGLPDDDYREFVRVCCDQFKVPAPDNTFLMGRLREISEGRPLVIEVIIQLRRSAGSYENALTLFEQSSGDETRNYVFSREWNALNSADKGREVLALLAIYGRPIAFEDIVQILMIDASKVKDALASVREMFLSSEETENGSVYSLGALTKSFVEQESQKLDFYARIHARVENFRKDFFPEDPEFSRFMQRAARASRTSQYGMSDLANSLWTEMFDSRLKPKLAESARFVALRGYVSLITKPIHLDQARSDFGRAFAFGYCPPIEQVRHWFTVERLSDMGDQGTQNVLDHVLAARDYDASIRAEFRLNRASYLYGVVRQAFEYEPERSFDRLEQSVRLHLLAFFDIIRLRSPMIQRSASYCRNTAFFLSQRLIITRDLLRFGDLVSTVAKSERVYLDPLSEPIVAHYREIGRLSNLSRSEWQRHGGKLEALVKIIDKKELWYLSEIRDSTVSLLRALLGEFNAAAVKSS